MAVQKYDQITLNFFNGNEPLSLQKLDEAHVPHRNKIKN